MSNTEKILSYLHNYPDSATLSEMFIEDSEPLNEVNVSIKMSTNAMVFSKYLTINTAINEAYILLQYREQILRSRLLRYYSGTTFDGEPVLDANLRPKTKTETFKVLELDVELINMKNQIEKLELLKQQISTILEFRKWEAKNYNAYADYLRFIGSAC